MAVRISLIHQIHGHQVEASTQRQTYTDDGTAVDWDDLRPCASCKLKFGKDDHDPCIANLAGVTNACCGHGLADYETSRPAVSVGEDGGFVFGKETKRHSWGYVQLEDGRRIEFSGTEGGERIRAAVAAALSGQSLPPGFRDAEAARACNDHEHDEHDEHAH